MRLGLGAVMLLGLFGLGGCFTAPPEPDSEGRYFPGDEIGRSVPRGSLGAIMPKLPAAKAVKAEPTPVAAPAQGATLVSYKPDPDRGFKSAPVPAKPEPQPVVKSAPAPDAKNVAVASLGGGEDAARLMGMARHELTAVLGPPNFRRRDDPAEIWQFNGESCILDVFLYRQGEEFRVSFVEARSTNLAKVSEHACITSLTKAR